MFCEYQLSCHDALAFCGDSIRLPWIDWQIAIDCQNVCHALRKRCRGYCGKWHQLVQLCVRVPIMFFSFPYFLTCAILKFGMTKKTRYNQTDLGSVFGPSISSWSRKLKLASQHKILTTLQCPFPHRADIIMSLYLWYSLYLTLWTTMLLSVVRSLSVSCLCHPFSKAASEIHFHRFLAHCELLFSSPQTIVQKILYLSMQQTWLCHLINNIHSTHCGRRCWCLLCVVSWSVSCFCHPSSKAASEIHFLRSLAHRELLFSLSWNRCPKSHNDSAEIWAHFKADCKLLWGVKEEYVTTVACDIFGLWAVSRNLSALTNVTNNSAIEDPAKCSLYLNMPKCSSHCCSASPSVLN